jgi:hypothetical protein
VIKTSCDHKRRIVGWVCAITMPLSALAVMLTVSGCDEKNLRDPRIGRGTGLRGQYYRYNNRAEAFDGPVLMTRNDGPINVDWGGSTNPFGSGSNDRFAIRWTGYIVPTRTATYGICTCSDDGVRITFQGDTIDEFDSQAARFWWTSNHELERGQRYPITIDYHEHGGPGSMKLYWVENPDGPVTDVCRSTEIGNPSNNQSDQCGDDYRINSPAVEIIPREVLYPAGDEAREALAACEVEPQFVSESQIPDPSDRNTQRALRLFERLAGVNVPIYDARVREVKQLLDQNRLKGAAKKVTEDHNFYDKVVRPFASKMSTQTQRTDEPLNDFIATVVGVTRDNVDARQLLTGNFLYRGKQVFYNNSPTAYNRMNTLESNEHYRRLDDEELPLMCALDELDRFNPERPPSSMRQYLSLPQDGDDRTRIDLNPEPAGVLTGRAWAKAHLVAGTNRRSVEKAFEEFLCAPMDSWRDAEISDEWVGRDVERFPDGPSSYNQYLTNCKTCHAPLDAMRGAFAKFHYEPDPNNPIEFGFLKYAPYYIDNPERFNSMGESRDEMKLSPATRDADPPNSAPRIEVTWKMNHNVNYPDGYMTVDSTYTNLLTENVHQVRFGWSSYTSGSSARDFGRMLAQSAAFPRCMARRAYSQVCRVDMSDPAVEGALGPWLDGIGDQFAREGYLLKDLFESLAVTCLD